MFYYSIKETKMNEEKDEIPGGLQNKGTGEKRSASRLGNIIAAAGEPGNPARRRELFCV